MSTPKHNQVLPEQPRKLSQLKAYDYETLDKSVCILPKTDGAFSALIPKESIYNIPLYKPWLYLFKHHLITKQGYPIDILMLFTNLIIFIIVVIFFVYCFKYKTLPKSQYYINNELAPKLTMIMRVGTITSIIGVFLALIQANLYTIRVKNNFRLYPEERGLNKNILRRISAFVTKEDLENNNIKKDDVLDMKPKKLIRQNAYAHLPGVSINSANSENTDNNAVVSLSHDATGDTLKPLNNTQNRTSI